MRRDVKLLHDVMADTIGYTCIQVKMSAASLQFARIQGGPRNTRVLRVRRDYKLTSLASLRDE